LEEAQQIPLASLAADFAVKGSTTPFMVPLNASAASQDKCHTRPEHIVRTVLPHSIKISLDRARALTAVQESLRVFQGETCAHLVQRDTYNRIQKAEAAKNVAKDYILMRLDALNVNCAKRGDIQMSWPEAMCGCAKNAHEEGISSLKERQASKIAQTALLENLERKVM
jgi:hypothetical protein